MSKIKVLMSKIMKKRAKPIVTVNTDWPNQGVVKK